MHQLSVVLSMFTTAANWFVITVIKLYIMCFDIWYMKIVL